MRYKFSEEQHKEIKEVRKKNRDKQIEKRLEVLELRCEGKGLEEIAKATNFHRSHVSNLIRRYFAEGLSSVSEKHYGGNRRNMSMDQEKKISGTVSGSGRAGTYAGYSRSSRSI